MNQEYYEIRLESFGGLGANLCGKMLGELFIKYLGKDSLPSSYGSEKTGTPVKGYVRYCDMDKEIRIHSPVTKPDLLVIFHEALLKDESVLSGCNEDTKIIISAEENSNIAKKINVKNCYIINAGKIAMETHSRINVVMLGAILKVMGVENTEAGEKICEDTLGKKYPDALQANLEGIRRGFAKIKKINLEGGMQIVSKQKQEWGYENAPLGGINPRFGNSVIADVSPSRQGYIPLFIKEKCINCGQCHATCPDMVFQFVKGEYKGKEMMINKGLDYYHCKGCLRCVDICPVNALVRGVEAEHKDKQYFITNLELKGKPKYYEKTGPDGYITSESYLTEKRMEGGEV